MKHAPALVRKCMLVHSVLNLITVQVDTTVCTIL